MTTLQDPRGGQACRPPAGAATTRAVRGYASGRDDYLTRLRRIEGQVRGVQKMIEDERWCPDVVTQLAAVTRAVQEVAVGVLNDHVHHCVLAVTRDSVDGGEAGMGDLAATIRQVIRL